MKLLRKLSSPLALVAQGFVAGAILFLSTHPGTGESIAASIGETTALVKDGGSLL